LIYIDTSVLVPFYLPEALSDAVDELLRIEDTPALSQLVEVELFSAVARKLRMREISPEEARQIAIDFQTDLDENFYTRIPLEAIHYNLARDWISRFEVPLRTLDALHLAVASSNQLLLVTGDEALARSARTLGIEVQLLIAVAEG
jgi:predicted nucleic acid-binding protein